MSNKMKDRVIITIAVGVVVFIVGLVIANFQGYPGELEYAFYYLSAVVAMSGYWIGTGRQD